MATQELVLIKKLCLHYQIEPSFFDDLNDFGLVPIQIVAQNKYLHQDRIGDLEKILRLHQDLNINIEGIDVILNLLEKEKAYKEEIRQLKSKLKLFDAL